LYIIFSLFFILKVFTTLHHELGHYIVAEHYQLFPRINYRSTIIYDRYRILNVSSKSSDKIVKELFYQPLEKKQHSHTVLGGFLLSFFSSVILLFAILLTKISYYKYAFMYRCLGSIFVAITLRFIYIPSINILNFLLKSFHFTNDELIICKIYSINIFCFNLLLLLYGLISIYYVLKPNYLKYKVVIAIILGTFFGNLVWKNALGPLILP